MNQLKISQASHSADHVHGTSSRMLRELEDTRDQLQVAMRAMDVVTREPRADLYQVSSTRLRLNQAGLRGCSAWGRLYECLLPRVDAQAAAALQSLQREHIEVLRHSSAHIGNWALPRIEQDWRGYCAAYVSIRRIMAAYMESEKRTLFPILKQERLLAHRGP